jgi:hypothetical protein
MKKNIRIIPALFSLIFFFSACEKDGELVYLPQDVTAPSLITVPDMNLKKDNAADSLEFVGTPLDLDISLSTTYIIDACDAGNNFEKKITIVSSERPDALKITVGDLNTLLLKTYDEFATVDLDFRLRTTLTTSAGRGVDPIEYISSTETKSVTTYGPPRLDVINSGIEQSLKSPKADDIYSATIKLDPAKPFTLLNPATNITYGGSDGTLVEDGAALVPEGAGWSKLTVDLKAMTYELVLYQVGIVGAFTEWGTQPDVPMDYNADKGFWFATAVTLPTGPMKFRLNSDWTLNWGPGTAPDTDVDLPDNGEMDLLNEWGNINIVVAGDYDIELTLDGTKGSVKFKLNS